MKYAIAVIVVILLGVLGWYFYPTVSSAPEMVAEDTVPTTETSTKKNVSIEWDFRLIEDGVSDPIVPQTDVAVLITIDGKTETRRLGSFEGSCAAQAAPDTITVLRPETKGYALCWFAGFGTEFVVSDTGTAVRVESREVDEGSAETGPVEGSFKTLTELTY